MTLGATATTVGKTYTCVKSGKSFLWDNGAAQKLLATDASSRMAKKAQPIGGEFHQIMQTVSSSDGSHLVAAANAGRLNYVTRRFCLGE